MMCPLGFEGECVKGSSLWPFSMDSLQIRWAMPSRATTSSLSPGSLHVWEVFCYSPPYPSGVLSSFNSLTNPVIFRPNLLPIVLVPEKRSEQDVPKRRRMKSKVLPPTYFVVLLLLSVCAHFVVPVIRVVASPYRYLGIVLIGFGVVLNLWTDSLFKKHKTPVKPYENPRHLETSGPFRISRHPMYLGMVSILLGIAIASGSLITFLFPILFVIVVEVMFVPFEERNLEQAFGKEYLDYKKKVRRLSLIHI